MSLLSTALKFYFLALSIARKFSELSLIVSKVHMPNVNIIIPTYIEITVFFLPHSPQVAGCPATCAMHRMSTI